MPSEIKVGASLSYFRLALTTLSGLLYTPFMLRYLGQSEYGLYMLIGSFVGYMSVLDFDLHNTIERFIAKYQAERDANAQENFLANTYIIYGFITIILLAIGTIAFFNLESIFSNSLSQEEIEKAKILFLILFV